MRILLVKTSSMGDVIQTFPALSDTQRFFPDVSIDWVVEENFADIPQWHSTIANTIVIPMRRWRKSWRHAWHSGEIQNFWQQVRKERYDCIIDAQGLCKSAIITRIARLTAQAIHAKADFIDPAIASHQLPKSKRCGYSFSTSRESLAASCYQRRFAIPTNQHAITRTRQLFAAALDYRLDEKELTTHTNVNYGIRKHIEIAAQQTIQTAPMFLQNNNPPIRPYVIFIHGTSRATKCWTEQQWIKLAQLAVAANVSVLLPWGSTTEEQCAHRIATAALATTPATPTSPAVPVASTAPTPTSASIQVLPKLTLTAIASLMLYAYGVVTVDTGLGHLAAALEVPTLTLYGPTQPKLIGTCGKIVKHLTDLQHLDALEVLQTLKALASSQL